jgi:hypothetical protein
MSKLALKLTKKLNNMGQIADLMIAGELCAECGVYLEPGETVYTQQGHDKVKMPDNGTGFGIPVLCKDCKDE